MIKLTFTFFILVFSAGLLAGGKKTVKKMVNLECLKTLSKESAVEDDGYVAWFEEDPIWTEEEAHAIWEKLSDGSSSYIALNFRKDGEWEAWQQARYIMEPQQALKLWQWARRQIIRAHEMGHQLNPRNFRVRTESLFDAGDGADKLRGHIHNDLVITRAEIGDATEARINGKWRSFPKGATAYVNNFRHRIPRDSRFRREHTTEPRLMILIGFDYNLARTNRKNGGEYKYDHNKNLAIIDDNITYLERVINPQPMREEDRNFGNIWSWAVD